MNKIKRNIKWAFKLYAITLVLPMSLTIINIIACGILGFETKFGFWGNFKIMWIDYYFTGILMGISAWRWQLVLLFCSFLCIKLRL